MVIVKVRDGKQLHSGRNVDPYVHQVFEDDGLACGGVQRGINDYPVAIPYVAADAFTNPGAENR